MLPEEQAANSRYFYELASGKFGWDIAKVKKVQAFHFKGGQGAKTGTGGHLHGIAIANSAMQAIGCLGMRACHTNNCPVGIATQKPNLRARLIVQQSAKQLKTFLEASVHLMQMLARACGHGHLNQFSLTDLTTWNRDIAYLTGVPYGGVMPLS